MSRFLLVIALLLIFITLSTFNPKNVKYKNIFLSIKNIEITNTQILNSEELKVIFYKELAKENMIFLDVNKIKKITSEVDLIDKIEIKKKYPSSIVVKIFEKKPIAIFFEKKNFFYITDKGDIIDFFESPLLKHLPDVIGSRKDFMEVFKVLKNTNYPLDDIKSYQQHAIGRWDIIINNNKIIKLPKENFEESIQNYIKIYNDPKFNKYSIFDYRIKDQLILN